MNKKVWQVPTVETLDVNETALDRNGGPRVDGGVYQNPTEPRGDKIKDTYGEIS